MNFLKRFARRLAVYDDGTLPREVSRNLSIIIISVLFGSVCFNTTGGSAFTGYIKKLGATDFMLGVLMAMPYCVRVMQIFVSYILERTRKRKFLMCALGITSRLMWIPIALVPLVVPMQQPMLRLWSILVLYALNAVTGTFIDTCFLSLAADVVPMRIRGRFFSTRSKLTMVVNILVGLIISYLLDNIAGHDGLLGYIIVFCIAGVFGATDIICFLFMRFPPMEGEEEGAKRESLSSMIANVLKNKPFMRLVLFWTVWGFSVNLAAPYFNVYMLEHLKMSYTQIMLLCTIPANLFSFLLVRRWGNMMDSYGYKPVLYICATIGALVPFLWMPSGPGAFAFTVLLAQSFSGAVWPAIDLSSQNTIMNAAPARNRSMYTAVYMVISQLCGVALGFIAGGYLLDNVFTPIASSLSASGVTLWGFPITQYHFLMGVSAVLRFLTVHLVLRFAGLDAEASTRMVMREVGVNFRKSTMRNVAMLRGQILRRTVRRRERKAREKLKNGQQ